MSAPTNAAARALREHISRDAPLREASVARFMAFVSGLSGVLALLLLPLLGARMGLLLAVPLFGLAAYYVVLIRLIGGGWFHPAVSWINVAIEVSAPALLFLIDTRQAGVQYALTAPPLVIWGTLIALSGLRSNKWLSLGAGALAAAEYTLLYVFLAWPRLGDEVLVTLRPPLFATRVVLLFASAVFTAVFVNHLNRRSEEALAAVRERDVFGKYLLHERLGLGGMAEVFRATYNPEGGFEKVVALKRVLPQYAQDENFIAMFRGEAALCSQFSHPNVVQVFDFGKFGDSYFLAMEYLDGPPLSRVLRAYRGEGLPVAAVVQVGIAVADALHYLHERTGADGQPLHLVHRDLNPPNILLTRFGEVKVTDFGIARSAAQVQLTDAGLVKGKPGYLAPEQATGEHIDGRTDLFALGITLWECLAGEGLFGSPDATEMLKNTFEKPVPSLRARRPDVPPALEALIFQLLERVPEKRTPSAAVALSALRGLGVDVTRNGTRSLASAVEVTLRTVASSATNLKPAEPRRPSSELPTLPGAR